MAIIKTVTNGDKSYTFRAVSLGHAVAIGFGLVSIIGTQQTWLWAGAHERRMIGLQFQTISQGASLNDLRVATLDAEVRALKDRMLIAEKQINFNTGRLEALRRER